MDLYELTDVRPVRITVCKDGANKQVWFLRKADRPAEDELIALTSQPTVIVKSDWSAVYCIVAEPGSIENGGLLAPEVSDRWASEAEIRKAAHYFMANGDLTVGMHDALDEYGQVVENAVAPATFSVEGPDGEKRKIKKGSWYIALTPNDRCREAIEAGEFNGISIEGSGVRTLVEKAAGGDGGGIVGLHTIESPDELLKSITAGGEWEDASKHFGEFGALCLALAASELQKAAPGPGLDRSPKKNWVERVGGFGKRNWIYRAAKWLANTKGMSIGHAIATAINAAKKGCATGDLNWPGKQSVNMGSRAQMCAAVAKWESMKARAGGLKKSNPGELRKSAATPVTVAEVVDVLDRLDRTDEEEPVKKGLLHAIAKKLGLDPDEFEAEQLAKRRITFGEAIAQQELEDELPKAFDTLRSVIWRAFYPMDSEDDDDPKAIVSQSLDEFGTWADQLLSRVMVSKADGEAWTEEEVAAIAKAIGAPPEGLIDGVGTLPGNGHESNREGDVALTAEERAELDGLKKGVGDLTELVKGIGEKIDAAQEPEPPTVEDLAKAVGKIGEELALVTQGVATLVDPGSTQDDGDGEAVAKANGTSPIGLLR